MRPFPDTDGREPRLSLWTLTFGPTVWALHFLACYVVGAVICAKAGVLPFGPGAFRWFVGAITAASLALIALAGWHAVRIWGFGADDPPHDDDTDEDRRHFLALATLLLCGLSFVAVLFTALPAAIVRDCR